MQETVIPKIQNGDALDLISYTIPYQHLLELVKNTISVIALHMTAVSIFYREIETIVH